MPPFIILPTHIRAPRSQHQADKLRQTRARHALYRNCNLLALYRTVMSEYGNDIDEQSRDEPRSCEDTLQPSEGDVTSPPEEGLTGEAPALSVAGPKLTNDWQSGSEATLAGSEPGRPPNPQHEDSRLGSSAPQTDATALNAPRNSHSSAGVCGTGCSTGGCVALGLGTGFVITAIAFGVVQGGKTG